MRSKIEANEYKDYILGFIFYKYLSDKEVKFLKENDYDDELLKTVSEEDDETVKWVQENIGYFISYKDLFSTWLSIRTRTGFAKASPTGNCSLKIRHPKGIQIQNACVTWRTGLPTGA